MKQLYLIVFSVFFLFVNSSFGQLQVKNSTNTVVMTVTDNGRLGVGTTNPQYKVDISGTLHVTNNAILDKQLTVKTLAGSGNINVYADHNGTLQKGGSLASVIAGTHHESLTPDSGSDEIVGFNFGHTFTTPPTVTATLLRDNNLCDAYIYIFNVSTTGANAWFSGAQNHPDCGSFRGFNWIAVGN